MSVIRRTNTCKNLLTGKVTELSYLYASGSIYHDPIAWQLFGVKLKRTHFHKYFDKPIPCALIGSVRTGLFIVQRIEQVPNERTLLIKEKTPLEMAEIIDGWEEDNR